MSARQWLQLFLGMVLMRAALAADVDECSVLTTVAKAGNGLNQDGTCPPCPRDNRMPCDEDGRTVMLNFAWSSPALSGPLPQDLDKLPALVTVVLSHNLFSGGLPASWGSMPSLEYLDLADNQLTGTLPESWANLKSLKTLILASTLLSGTLPASWTRLERIQHLQLSNIPNLQGNWPSYEFEDITYLDLNGTGISSSSFVRWWLYLCTLENTYTVVLPNGTAITNENNPICPSNMRKRTILVLALFGGFVLVLAVVLLWRLCRRAGADVLEKSVRCLPLWAQHLVFNVVDYWPSFSMFINVGTDLWVLVQVYPRDSKSVWWPFGVLLAGLLTPETISVALAFNTWMRARWPACPRSLPWLLLPLALPGFTLWLAAAMLLHSSRVLWHHILCCRHPDHLQALPSRQGLSQAPDAPAERGCCARSLTDVIDPERVGSLLGSLTMVLEDPTSAVVTSIFFVVNKRRVGQLITTPGYCLSVVASYMHIVLEVGRWAAVLRKDGWRAVPRAFDIRRGVHPRSERLSGRT